MAAEANPLATEVDDSTLKKVEEYIEQEEGVHHRFAGAWGTFLFAVAVAMSLFHLWAAYGNINPDRKSTRLNSSHRL